MALWDGYKDDQYMATIRASSKDSANEEFRIKVKDKQDAKETAKELERIGRSHDKTYKVKVVSMEKLVEVVE